MKSKAILIFLFIALIGNAQSTREVSTRNLSWVGIFAQYNFSPSWNVNLDAQARYEYTDGDWFAWLIRPGLTWTAKNKIMLTGGVGVVALYPNPNSRPPRPEIRPWQEIGKKFTIKKHFFYPRYRLEQRFIRQYDLFDFEDNFSFASFRSRARVDYSYNITPDNARGFLLLAGNEYMFATTTKGKTTFDQNRAYLGIGYRLNKSFTFQLTYLNLFQRTGSNIFEQHHTIRLILFMTFSKPENTKP